MHRCSGMGDNEMQSVMYVFVSRGKQEGAV